MEPALSIETSDYFNKSQYKGSLVVIGDGTFGNYHIEWSESRSTVPDQLKGTFTDTITAKQKILAFLEQMKARNEFKERKATAKVARKPQVKGEEDG